MPTNLGSRLSMIFKFRTRPDGPLYTLGKEQRISQLTKISARIAS
jgi:hypothetical protein